MITYNLHEACGYGPGENAVRMELLIPDGVSPDMAGEREEYGYAVLRIIIDGKIVFETRGAQAQRLLWQINNMIDVTQILKDGQKVGVHFPPKNIFQ